MPHADRRTCLLKSGAPVSGTRQFFSRNLVKLTPCLTPSRIYPKSDKAKLRLPFNQADYDFFYFGRRFSAGTWPSSVHAWARGVGDGITSDRGLASRSPPDLHSLTKNTSLGHKDRDFYSWSTSTGHVWTIVFLFAEHFRLCVNRNFDTIFDPVLPEPNRIFGFLNLSNVRLLYVCLLYDVCLLCARRFRLPSLHILHVRCQFCVIRAVRRNLQFLPV